jgi:hypothetical protein
MKVVAPIKKINGESFSSLEAIIAAYSDNSDLTWLDPNKQINNQAVYLNQTSIYGQREISQPLAENHPVLSMVAGEIVACRLNSIYPTVNEDNKTLAFSNGFVLVKSTVKPDPALEKTWLNFYILYQGIAALSDLPQQTTCYEARVNVVLRKYSPTESTSSAENPANVPDKTGLILNKGERIVISETKTFLNAGKSQPFGLAKKITSDGTAENSVYWVTILPEYMQQLQTYVALTSVNMRTATDASLDNSSATSLPVP